MNRNEQEMYSNISSIAKSLEKIAKALDNNVTQTTKDIPGFEGVLNDLDNLYQPEEYDTKNDELHKLVQNLCNNDYLEFCSIHNLPSNDEVFVSNYIAELDYEECLDAIKVVENIVEEFKLQNMKYETDYVDTTNGKIKNDLDHDIRSTAAYYEEALSSVRHRDLKTKKDAILDYVTNEFGTLGARYTDIIKFAYYLGCSNAPKYDNSCRGYYAMAFNTRFGGHLIQGGKDFLVKGINKNGKERYFAYSSVNKFTDYYKRID